MIIDPISDMLTRIRNASAVRKAEVAMPFSKMKLALAKILEREGFVAKTEVQGEAGGHQLINLSLKYQNREPAITSIQRVSTPGRRLYAGYQELHSVRNGLGIAIISTPQGLMTNKEARQKKIGGELLCEVY